MKVVNKLKVCVIYLHFLLESMTHFSAHAVDGKNKYAKYLLKEKIKKGLEIFRKLEILFY